MKTLLMTLALASIGCSFFSGNDPEAAYCTSNIEEDKEALVDMATSAWNDALPSIVNLHRSEAGEHCFLHIVGYPAGIQDCVDQLGIECSGALMPYYPGQDHRTIKVWTEFKVKPSLGIADDDALRITLLHELGHYLGADHSKNHKDIMSKNWSHRQPNATLTDNDINQVYTFQTGGPF